MADYRTVKARKIHKCTVCSGVISKGDRYEYMECRIPIYASDVMGNQVQNGIEYFKIKICAPCDEAMSHPEYAGATL